MNNDWLDIEVLEDYLDGKLDAKTMNKVEREALNDPFVAEALAGLSKSPRRSLDNISLLQRQLQERIAEQKTIKKRSVITWQRLSIGSAAAVMFITAGIVFWMKQVNFQQKDTEKRVEVALAPAPAADTVVPLPTPAADELAAASKAKVVGGQDLAVNNVSKRSLVQTQPAPMAFSARAIAPDTSGYISGKVFDEKTGDPMVGVSVAAQKNGELRVIGQTNKAGEFRIKKDSNLVNQDLLLSYVSYDSQTIKPAGSNLVVKLKETPNTLSDQVVVRGYVKRTKEETTGSSFVVTGKEVTDVPVANVPQLLQGKVAGLNIQNNTGAPGMRGTANIKGLDSVHKPLPLGGWDQYYMYLNNNNKFKAEKRVGKAVLLVFSIKADGTPTDIVVFRGISNKYNKEALRLLTEGPKWEPVKSGSAKFVIEVYF